MSVELAMSSAALAQSNYAAQQAHEAAVTACHGFIQSYSAAGATVDAMHAYASCVYLLYPVGEVDYWFLKMLIISCAIGFIVGMLLGWHDKRERIQTMFCMGLIGSMIAPCASAMIYGVYWALT